MFQDKEGLLDLEALAQKHLRRVRRNLPTPLLYEEIVKNREGQISHLGPIVVRTGNCTQRSFEDRFVVTEPTCKEKVWWCGKNKPISEEHFKSLFYRLLAYLQNRDVYVQDCYTGAHPKYRIPIRIVTETAWHSLFARNMFIQIHDYQELRGFRPAFTVVHIPRFQAIPELDGTKSNAFIIANMAQRVVFIGGTSYAGEIKQAVFTITDYLLPSQDILPVRCSVNQTLDGEVAMFLGRSGAGKTSLATDPERALIGDDQHGWTEEGLFNFEWGCYARGLQLSQTNEPLIYETTRKFGTILENVSIDPYTRRLDLDDESLTDNTRAAYPISHIPNAKRGGICGHPKHIFFLTRDPYGVLPSIARLTPDQAVFVLLSSYTPELADVEPEARGDRVVHSACFGASPLLFKPQEYALMFRSKLARHQPKCWLMNTGWAGDPKGRGPRVAIGLSRQLVHAAISGLLDEVPYDLDPVFQYEIPQSCPGIPSDLLNPRALATDEFEYEIRANRLATDFMQDFTHFIDEMPNSIREMLSKIELVEDGLDIMSRFEFSL